MTTPAKKRTILCILLAMLLLVACHPEPVRFTIVTVEPTQAPASTPAPTMMNLLPERQTLLPLGDAGEHGFDEAKLQAIDDLIQSDVAQGFPGAVLLVTHGGEIIHSGTFGYAKRYDGKKQMEDPIIMQGDTLFDIASLTKVFGTMLAIMKLVDEGILSLDIPIYHHIEAFDQGLKRDITVRMLLRHCAGYGSDIRFFDPNSEDAQRYYSRDRDLTLSLLSQIELEHTPASVYKYTDTDYMVLCALIEHITGQRLDDYLQEHIYTPLGLEGRILYEPLEHGIMPFRMAATERMGNTRDGAVYFEGIRDYTLQGEVHDEKTYYSLDGVSGHAGLFADAESLAVLSQLLMDGGAYQGVRIFSAETVDAFLHIYDDEKYQLGLWNASHNKDFVGMVSSEAFYHYGWTGVATVMDKGNDMTIILLTNKRHTPCEVDDFEGNLYDTGRYKKIIQMVYEALS